MRDYAMNRALSYNEGRGVSIFGRLLRNWRARRSVAHLQGFDDYMLNDIGVSRDDVSWAVGLPLTVNAALALEERSTKQRRMPHID